MLAPEATEARRNAAELLATVEPPPDLAEPGPASAGVAEDLAQHAEPAQLAAEGGEPEDSSLFPAAFLLVTLGAEAAARRFGPRWAITEARARAIARPLVRIANKYAPALEAFGPETELALALGDYALAGLGGSITLEAQAHVAPPSTEPT